MNPQDSRYFSIATRLWPQIEEMEQSNRQRALMAMVTMIFLLPFAILGLVWLLLVSACIGPVRLAASEAAAPPRPNIVILFVDDMGFSDIGCFGGEIDTATQIAFR